MDKAMSTFKAKINESGRIVIPAPLRRALSLKPDEELVLHLRENELVVTPLKICLKRLRDKVRKYNSSNASLTDALKKLRTEDDSHA